MGQKLAFTGFCEKNSYSKLPTSLFAIISLSFGIILKSLTSKILLIFFTVLTLNLFIFIFNFIKYKIKYPKPKQIAFSVILFLGFFLYQNQNNKHDIIYNSNNKNGHITGIIESIKRAGFKNNGYLVTIKPLNKIPYTDSFIFYSNSKSINKAKISDKIKLKNILISKPSNHSYYKYLIKENTYNIKLQKKSSYTILNRPKFSYQKILTNSINKVLKKLELKLSENSFCLFSNIFLGKKNIKNIKNHTYNFSIWGLSHILARSGLHLLLIYLLLKFILILLNISHIKTSIIISITLGLFYLISWPSISFTRALLLFFSCSICLILKLQVHPLHLLSLVTLFILITNPIQLFFLDFQLSFSLTYALILASIQSRKNSIA